MTLHRKNGKTLTYHFKQSYADFLGKVLDDIVISLNLYEMKDDVPCLLLMCAETQSIITKIHRQSRFKMMHVVTITEDDNLMSNYGRRNGDVASGVLVTACSLRDLAPVVHRGIV